MVDFACFLLAKKIKKSERPQTNKKKVWGKRRIFPQTDPIFLIVKSD